MTDGRTYIDRNNTKSRINQRATVILSARRGVLQLTPVDVCSGRIGASNFLQIHDHPY